MAGVRALWQTGAMRAAFRVLMLVLGLLVLDHCASAPIQGCDQIAQKSTGGCRVGLPTYWYYDDQWRTQ